jgi:hypothetical protein
MIETSNVNLEKFIIYNNQFFRIVISYWKVYGNFFIPAVVWTIGSLDDNQCSTILQKDI